MVDKIEHKLRFNDWKQRRDNNVNNGNNSKIKIPLSPALNDDEAKGILIEKLSKETEIKQPEVKKEPPVENLPEIVDEKVHGRSMTVTKENGNQGITGIVKSNYVDEQGKELVFTTKSDGKLAGELAKKIKEHNSLTSDALKPNESLVLPPEITVNGKKYSLNKAVTPLKDDVIVKSHPVETRSNFQANLDLHLKNSTNTISSQSDFTDSKNLHLKSSKNKLALQSGFTDSNLSVENSQTSTPILPQGFTNLSKLYLEAFTNKAKKPLVEGSSQTSTPNKTVSLDWNEYRKGEF